MKFEPGDLLVGVDMETRLVIKIQPYVGLSRDWAANETETLLMYSNGSTRWYSSKWLEKTMKKVGDDTEELE